MIRLVAPLALALVAALPLRAQVAVQEITSPGGIDAWLVEERSIPFVALEFAFRGGAVVDPDGLEGVTALMAAMLSEGAGDLDSRAFAAQTEALATSFRFNAGMDTVTISASMLTENRDEAAALLRLALAEPRFDPDALERLRARAISGARSDERNPNAIAGREFAAMFYPDHPYARRADGTAESLADITRGDLIAQHGKVLARDRLHVSAVGDIDAEDLGELLDYLLGWLPETGAPLPDRAATVAQPGLTVIDFDGPQSVVLFGHAGIPRDDDDFLTAFVMMEAFGGGRFGTRLMREVRVNRGLTYGIGAYLVSRGFGETVRGQFSTDNARVGEAIAAVRAEWARMAEEGLSAEELASIQTYLTGAYPLRFDGNGNIASILVGMQLQGMPADYMNFRNDLVDALTVEDIAAIAARVLDPEALHFVVVGRPEGLEVAN